MNIPYYDHILYPYMKERLETFCPDYRKAPDMYTIKNEEALKERYSDLQLRDTSELRLDHLCRLMPGHDAHGIAGESH